MWLQDHICFGKRYSQVRMTMGGTAPFRLTAFGTFPKGQARRTAEHKQVSLKP